MGSCCATTDTVVTPAKGTEAAIVAAVQLAEEEVRCYCGACKVKVSGPPTMQVFCNCDDCRKWGGGCAQAAKLYPADKVKVTGDLLSLPYKEGSGSWRKSCATCGGAVVDDKSSTPFNMIMVPAGLFDSPFQPSMHIQYEWKIFSHGDDVPKYKVLPKAMGAPEEELVDDSVAPNPRMKADHCHDDHHHHHHDEVNTVSCYCGACRLTVAGEPAMQICCHCDDCRRWGGAIFQAAKLYPADKVTMKGKFLSKDKEHRQGMSSWRQCCATCGGVAYDDKSKTPFKMIMIPAGLFDAPFTPEMHINYGMKVYSVKDGLPKYKALPKAMGAPEEEIVPE
mmetsp:Transcript_78746/g.143508  ORF Transcript_78746/g.143508 Transcript_78746/m.143508 type:complete len:336 (-) Transcript_78746:409-1416(-)